MRQVHKLLVGILTVLLLQVLMLDPALAQEVSPLDTTIEFNEYPFPPPTQILQGPDGTSSVSYNLWDDATGEKLSGDNGDLADVTFGYSTSAPGALGATNRPSIEINPTTNNQITGRTGFAGQSPGHPGTRQWYTVRVLFADHLDITDVTIDTNSLNTAGISWEFTVVSFLDKSGSLFSPIPDIDLYLAFEPGVTGPVGTGHFLAGETGTVQGVGTDLTSSGTSGTHDQVDDTISTSDVTLPGAPLIGGFIFTTTLEDVRGADNGSTNFSSSIRQIDLSGTITQVIAETELTLAKVGEVQDDQVVYEVTVTNNGPIDATNVVVIDDLPPAVEYVSDTCGGELLPPWTWALGTLAVGETETCTVATAIVDPGLIENRASVTADQDLAVPEDGVSSAVIDTLQETQPTTTTTTAAGETTTTTTITTTTALVTLPFTGSENGGLMLFALGLLALGLLVLASMGRRSGQDRA